MYPAPHFAIKSRSVSSVVCIIMGIIFGFISLSMVNSLADDRDTAVGAYVTILIMFSVLAILCFVFAERSVRRLVVQDGILTEIRGKFFKRVLTMDLQSVSTVVGMYKSPIVIPDHVYFLNSISYIMLKSETKIFLLGPAYYSKKNRTLILELIRPLLENPQIEKNGNIEAALNKYYRKYHPRFDEETNIVYLDRPTMQQS